LSPPLAYFHRLADLLTKVQKALGDYLEKQRSSFPRFYFVGDEDLLEIIGNSKDLGKIQKHLKKMFAGIASFTLDKDMTSILGMVSPEGEQVPWPAPVAVKDSTIIDWLSKAELQMKLSLVALLGDAIAELTVLQETPDNDKYAGYIGLFVSFSTSSPGISPG
jgi:dynein heavy chain 1